MLNRFHQESNFSDPVGIKLRLLTTVCLAQSHNESANPDVCSEFK